MSKKLKVRVKKVHAEKVISKSTLTPPASDDTINKEVEHAGKDSNVTEIAFVDDVIHNDVKMDKVKIIDNADEDIVVHEIFEDTLQNVETHNKGIESRSSDFAHEGKLKTENLQDNNLDKKAHKANADKDDFISKQEIGEKNNTKHTNRNRQKKEHKERKTHRPSRVLKKIRSVFVTTLLLAIFALVITAVVWGIQVDMGSDTPLTRFVDDNTDTFVAIGDFLYTNAGLLISVVVILLAIGIFKLGQAMLVGSDGDFDIAPNKITVKGFIGRLIWAVGLMVAIPVAIWFLTDVNIVPMLRNVTFVPEEFELLQTSILLLTAFFIIYSIDWILRAVGVGWAYAFTKLGESSAVFWGFGIILIFTWKIWIPLLLTVLILAFAIPLIFILPLAIAASLFKFLKDLETLIFKKPIEFKFSRTLKALIPVAALILPVLFTTGFMNQTASEIVDEVAGTSTAIIETGLELPLTTTNTTHLVSNNQHYYITSGGVLRIAQWERDGFVYTDIDTDVRTIEHVGATVFYIKNDNSLWGFGSNANGFLGTGTGLDEENPVMIMEDVVKLTTTGNVAIVYAIKTDSTLWRWGRGEFSPVLVEENIVEIVYSGSTYFTYAINSSGIAIIIGENNRNYGRRTNFPVQTFWGRVDVRGRNVNINGYYIDENNVLWHSRTGNEIAQDVEKLFGFGGSSYHTYENILFIKADGSLWGMGNNRDGLLGDGTLVPREDAPIHIADNVINAGRYFYLTAYGELWTWDSDSPTPTKTFDSVAHVVPAIGTSHRGFDGSVLFNDGTLVLQYMRFNQTDEAQRELYIAAGVLSPHVLTGVKIPQTHMFVTGSDLSIIEPPPPPPESELLIPHAAESMIGSGAGSYTDPHLASVYHAYRELLLEALDYLGDAYLEDNYGWVSGYYGVQHAEIIDFDNDGTPELLLIIGSGETLTIHIFTYLEGIVSLVEKELWIWMDGFELYIATSVDGKSYLVEVQWGGSVDGERDASYQVLVNGNFESMLETFSWNTVGASGMPTSRNFTVNRQNVSEEYYDNAPMEYLGIPLERLLFCSWEPVQGWQSAHVAIDELNSRIAALEA